MLQMKMCFAQLYWARDLVQSSFGTKQRRKRLACQPVSYTHLDVYKRQILYSYRAGGIVSIFDLRFIEQQHRFPLNGDIANRKSGAEHHKKNDFAKWQI